MTQDFKAHLTLAEVLGVAKYFQIDLVHGLPQD
jgi:hypothetical protein